MEFKVWYVSNPYSGNETVTVSSIEELKEFSEKKGCRLVIDFEEMIIWVADAYLSTI